MAIPITADMRWSADFMCETRSTYRNDYKVFFPTKETDMIYSWKWFSTIATAHKMSRKWIGVDWRPRYISKTRMDTKINGDKTGGFKK